LEGLQAQSFTNFGVIVVDDASDVPALDIVAEPEFAALDIRTARMPSQSGPAAARNAGVALSSAEYIVFIDDDVRPDWKLLEAHIKAVTNPTGSGPVLSCGPFVEPADWDPTPWNRWEARQAKHEADSLLRGDYPATWRQFHTGNNCLPRQSFIAAGGFNEEFKRAEDDELAWRLHEIGCTFHFEASAIAWHYSERTLEAWLLIPRSYARYDVEIDRLHPESDHLRRKTDELKRRHPGLRAARWLLPTDPLQSIGIGAATFSARVLYRIGLVDSAMMALSAAYDLAYVQSLRKTMREQRLST